MTTDDRPAEHAIAEAVTLNEEQRAAAEERRRIALSREAHALIDRAGARIDAPRLAGLRALLEHESDLDTLAALAGPVAALRARSRPPEPTWAERVASAVEVMHRRADKIELPLATPWKSVNKALRGGLWPGLYTLTGATGTGKTQWAIQCALGAAAAGVPTSYIALELGEVDMVSRMLAELALAEETPPGGLRYPLRWSDLFYGLHPRALADVRDRYQAKLAALPFHLETASAIGWSYRDLESVAEEHRPRLLVLDYAQLVTAPEGVREELRQTIGAVAKVARNLARKGMVVLALSSTARSNYGAFRGVPLGGDLPWMIDAGALVGAGKESGELEYAADVVLALAKAPREWAPPKGYEKIAVDTASDLAAAWEAADELGRKRDGDVDPVWVVGAKGRGFGTMRAPLAWDGSHFGELQGYHPRSGARYGNGAGAATRLPADD
jgi:hypothetical protein